MSRGILTGKAAGNEFYCHPGSILSTKMVRQWPFERPNFGSAGFQSESQKKAFRNTFRKPPNRVLLTPPPSPLLRRRYSFRSKRKLQPMLRRALHQLLLRKSSRCVSEILSDEYSQALLYCLRRRCEEHRIVLNSRPARPRCVSQFLRDECV